MAAEGKIKEYEEVYFWIDKIITGSDTLPQIDACQALIDYFEYRKFKKDIPTKKEMRDYTTILKKFIKRKRGAIRKRLFIERKNNGNGKV